MFFCNVFEFRFKSIVISDIASLLLKFDDDEYNCFNLEYESSSIVW